MAKRKPRIDRIDSVELRRFDDFIKLLAGLGVGQFLRDAHSIRDAMRAVMTPGSAVLTEIFPYVFVALVVRNVHASFRYDVWSVARKFSPEYEGHLAGRAFSVSASIVALFVSTYAVDHYLAGHLAPAVGTGAAPDLAQLVRKLSVFLGAPFLIYAVWDGVLWIGAQTTDVRPDRIMQKFVRRWIALDILALVALLIGLVAWVVIQPADQGLWLLVMVFTVVAGGTVIADYVSNASFYFAGVRAVTKRERPDVAGRGLQVET